MKKDIEDYFEGLLNDEQKNQLYQQIDKDPELKDYFLGQLRIHSVLNTMNESENHRLITMIHSALGDKDILIEKVLDTLGGYQKLEKPKPFTKIPYIILANAAVLTIGFIMFFYFHTGNKNIVAVSQDNLLVNSPYSLTSKEYKDFRTPLGVKLLIQGPADFLLEENNKLALNQGRIFAEVPPEAVGFTVVTPDGIIKDLSTEFGIDVNKNKTEVHVVKGAVVARLHNGENQQISNGFALNLSKDKNLVAPLNYNGSSFAQSLPQGKVISINFGRYKCLGRTGFIPAEHWNNLNDNTRKQTLINDLGQITDTFAQINNASSKGTVEVINTDNDTQRLFKGRLNHTHHLHNKDDPVDPLQIKIENVKFKKYDLYVYYWMGRRSDNHIFDLQVNNGKKYRIHRPTPDSKDNESFFTLWQGEGRGKSGNTQVFKGLSGPNIEVKAILPKNSNEHRSWYICGLQIVAIE